MRGRGRVYRPPNGSGEAAACWMLDYSVGGHRYRESSGKTVKAEAVEEVERRIKLRKEGRPVEPPAPTTLKAYAARHWEAKAKETDRHGQPVTKQWMAAVRQHLDRAIDHFGPARLLGSITRADLLQWVAALGQRFGGGATRQHLNSLSNMFRRAVADGLVTANPVAALMPAEKPRGSADEAGWLEVPEAAWLLDAAKHYEPTGVPWVYPFIATMLLTGGRRAEVLGLEVDDVDLKRKTVTFRPNQWRRLKTKHSHRVTPLWPQLAAILLAWFPQREQLGPGTLLFPIYRGGREAMMTNVQKLVDAVAKRAGWKRGEITPKMFRHTYISARIQTTQHGAPVAAFTVAREVGHSSTAMIEKTYGHLGEVQHRAGVVEYRVEQHRRAVARLRHTVRHTSP